MIPKFSVKKPMTVFVIAVLIIVTGIVAFTKMTPDLLPNMDMPYVMVMTPYAGATPEKVERTVTKPLEQNLSTLENLKTITSVSNANYSMIIMEFENDVNMDTVSSDVLQQINIAGADWDDSVGTSTIMKMNPSMIPVSVAAVSYQGKNRQELSNFMKDTLQNKLDGIDGVAKVDASGTLDEKVNVVLSQEKINNINNKILASVNSQLASAQAQLDSQTSKLTASQAKIDKAAKQLESTKQYMPAETYNEQKSKLDAASRKLAKARSQLSSAQASLDSKAASARKQANIKNKITTDMISGVLKGQNFSMPAGYVEEGGGKYLVSVGDSITSESQAKNLYLFDSGVEGVGKIYLKDVADVFVSDNSNNLYAKINGKDGVILSFNKQSNYATADACTNIKAEFKSLSKEYKGLKFTSLMNQGDYINMVIDAILSSLLWGALFSILILLLFLRGIRPTIITICSIPISLIFALALMYFSGISINLISMSGLAVSVGMLVDNSVVVIENTVRLRRQGISATRAAVAGAKQVSGAITASTLTTICVFVPIIFTAGLTRELFTDMALTVAYSLVASLIIALTLVPAMSSKMLGGATKPETRFFLSMLEKYRRSLAFVLKHKAPILILAVALLVVSVAGTVSRGFIFMPDMNSPQLSATLEMPKGSSVDDVFAAADKAMTKMEKVDGVATVGAIMPTDDMSMGGSTGSGVTISYYIMMKDGSNRLSSAVAKDINDACAGGAGTVTASGSSMSDFTDALGGSGVTVNVYGEDMDDLQTAAQGVAAKMSATKGIDVVDDGMEDADKEYHFVVDKSKAMAKGLTVAQVYAAIVDKMTYENTATTVTWSGDDYDVVVSSDQKQALTPAQMRNLTISVKNSSGSKVSVKVNDIATLEKKAALKSIGHEDQSRYIQVTGTLKEGYNITKTTAAVEKQVAKYDLPKGVTVEYTGEDKTIRDSMTDLVEMLLLGILFVYLIMVAQFQSLKSPFIIMFTIPLAFTGGLLALLITGKEISVIAMLGFVMLCGIIVNNGIVLVDFINQLRAKGIAKRDAIIEAGATRMRPILMTSLTTILGLLVMAFGKTAGTDMMQPIALVCIGGLLYATALTLYIVPVIYDIMNGEKYKHVTEADVDISGI